ncbi:hypothetical protein HGRIS_000698 [Hohenbuehelia grisea]|uniref:Uncharacterized protein n=1 Tax=Hohenbuehelia grisea TaxID=104357 RepID=A0ABR3JTQ8_9AGAR
MSLTTLPDAMDEEAQEERDVFMTCTSVDQADSGVAQASQPGPSTIPVSQSMASSAFRTPSPPPPQLRISGMDPPPSAAHGAAHAATSSLQNRVTEVVQMSMPGQGSSVASPSLFDGFLYPRHRWGHLSLMHPSIPHLCIPQFRPAIPTYQIVPELQSVPQNNVGQMPRALFPTNSFPGHPGPPGSAEASNHLAGSLAIARGVYTSASAARPAIMPNPPLPQAMQLSTPTDQLVGSKRKAVRPLEREMDATLNIPGGYPAAGPSNYRQSVHQLGPIQASSSIFNSMQPSGSSSQRTQGVLPTSLSAPVVPVDPPLPTTPTSPSVTQLVLLRHALKGKGVDRGNNGASPSFVPQYTSSTAASALSSELLFVNTFASDPRAPSTRSLHDPLQQAVHLRVLLPQMMHNRASLSSLALCSQSSGLATPLPTSTSISRSDRLPGRSAEEYENQNQQGPSKVRLRERIVHTEADTQRGNKHQADARADKAKLEELARLNDNDRRALLLATQMRTNTETAQFHMGRKLAELKQQNGELTESLRRQTDLAQRHQAARERENAENSAAFARYQKEIEGLKSAIKSIRTHNHASDVASSMPDQAVWGFGAGGGPDDDSPQFMGQPAEGLQAANGLPPSPSLPPSALIDFTTPLAQPPARSTPCNEPFDPARALHGQIRGETSSAPAASNHGAAINFPRLPPPGPFSTPQALSTAIPSVGSPPSRQVYVFPSNNHRNDDLGDELDGSGQNDPEPAHPHASRSGEIMNSSHEYELIYLPDKGFRRIPKPSSTPNTPSASQHRVARVQSEPPNRGPFRKASSYGKQRDLLQPVNSLSTPPALRSPVLTSSVAPGSPSTRTSDGVSPCRRARFVTPTSSPLRSSALRSPTPSRPPTPTFPSGQPTAGPSRLNFFESMATNVDIGGGASPSTSESMLKNLTAMVTSLHDKLQENQAQLQSHIVSCAGSTPLSSPNRSTRGPYRANYSPRPRTALVVEMHGVVRESMQQKLHIRNDHEIAQAIAEHDLLATEEEEADAFSVLGVQPSLDPMKLYWDEKRHLWNFMVADLFTAEFCVSHDKYSPEDVREHFLNRFYSLRRTLKKRLTHPGGIKGYMNHLRQQKRCRRRKSDRLKDRLETAKNEESKLPIPSVWTSILQVATLLGVEGMSSDESDKEEPDVYTVTTKPWCAHDIGSLLRHADGAHRSLNAYGNARPGKHPCQCNQPLNAKESSKDALFRLPSNFYNPLWLAGVQGRN